MRISLKEKILKIATLPNYESVIELDDPNKIQPKTEYRVFVLIYFDGDLIEITDIIESDAFENDKFWFDLLCVLMKSENIKVM